MVCLSLRVRPSVRPSVRAGRIHSCYTGGVTSNMDGIICECSMYMISKKRSVFTTLKTRALELGLLINELDLDALASQHDEQGSQITQEEMSKPRGNVPHAILHKVENEKNFFEWEKRRRGFLILHGLADDG